MKIKFKNLIEFWYLSQLHVTISNHRYVTINTSCHEYIYIFFFVELGHEFWHLQNLAAKQSKEY